MLAQLYNLIFGEEGYSRVKIEERILEVETLLKKDSIKINNLEDFEILEKVIYKIKEDLRVGSSNLSKAIKDPSRPVKKRDIESIVERLSTIRYEFLKDAFAKGASSKTENQEHKISSNDTAEVTNSYESSSKGQESSAIPEKKEINTEEPNTEKDKSSLETSEGGTIISQNDSHFVSVEAGKTPYIFVHFSSEIDFSYLKVLASQLFEVKKCEGTNIIIEGGTRALIIPRMSEDNVVELQRTEADIEKAYNAIEETITKNNSSQEYVSIDSEKPSIKSKKNDDESFLESRLKEEEDKSLSYNTTHENKEEKNSPVVEKGDSVEVEKKEKSPEEKNNIEVEKFPNKEIKEDEDLGVELYRDDKVLAYIKENSKSKSELIIEDINKRTLEELEEGDLAYIFIFVKAFSGVLFETAEAAGTNVLYDFGKRGVSIVPRYENDALGFTWNPEQSTDEFLDEVKKKLISGMGGDTSSSNGPDNSGGGSSSQEDGEKSPKEKKAEYLLESINNIP